MILRFLFTIFHLCENLIFSLYFTLSINMKNSFSKYWFYQLFQQSRLPRGQIFLVKCFKENSCSPDFVIVVKLVDDETSPRKKLAASACWPFAICEGQNWTRAKKRSYDRQIFSLCKLPCKLLATIHRLEHWHHTVSLLMMLWILLVYWDEDRTEEIAAVSRTVLLLKILISMKRSTHNGGFIWGRNFADI